MEAGEIEATAMQHLPRMAAPGIVAVVKFLTTDGRSENTPGLNFAQDGGDRGHRDARSGVRRPPPRTWRLANAGDGRRRCRRRAIAGCLPVRDPGSDPFRSIPDQPSRSLRPRPLGTQGARHSPARASTVLPVRTSKAPECASAPHVCADVCGRDPRHRRVPKSSVEDSCENADDTVGFSW